MNTLKELLRKYFLVYRIILLIILGYGITLVLPTIAIIFIIATTAYLFTQNTMPQLHLIIYISCLVLFPLFILLYKESESVTDAIKNTSYKF